MTLVIHELRSPLGYLVSAARAVAVEANDAWIRERCETMERTAERMLRTADTLLLASRVLERPAKSMRYAPVAVVAGIVRDAAGLGAHIRLVTDHRAGTVEVHGRPVSFELLIQSLVNNALDHHDIRGEVVVHVAANDIAITVELRNEIPGHRRHEGLGLGTRLCADLARQCGARFGGVALDGHYVTTVVLPLRRSPPTTHSQRLSRWSASSRSLLLALISA